LLVASLFTSLHHLQKSAKLKSESNQRKHLNDNNKRWIDMR